MQSKDLVNLFHKGVEKFDSVTQRKHESLVQLRNSRLIDANDVQNISGLRSQK